MSPISASSTRPRVSWWWARPTRSNDVGTGRLSRGLLDRFLVLDVDYQPRHEEIEIVLREAPAAGDRLAAFAVDLARRTREHPDLRHGASIRAAIDLASLLAAEAVVLRDEPDPVLLRCLVCAAFTGRVRLRPTATHSACDLVMDLFTGLSAETADGVAALLAERPARGRSGRPSTKLARHRPRPTRPALIRTVPTRAAATRAAARTPRSFRAWNERAAAGKPAVPGRCR